MFRKFTLIIISFILVTTYSCKKDCSDPRDPKCDNYDPCFGKQATKANFIIEEEVGPLLIETDTVYGVNMIRCTPTVEYDSLKWLIGTEIVTESILRRRNFPEYERIAVTLIVYKSAETSCFPNDNGIDSLTKTFYSAPKDSLLFFGYYNGSNLNQTNDTFTLRTVTYDTNWGNIFDIRNLPKGTKDAFSSTNVEFGGRAVYTKSSNNGMQSRFALEASLVVRNGKIRVDYSFNNEAYQAWLEGRTAGSSQRVSKTFTGKKL